MDTTVKKYDKRVDIWAIGVLLFELLHGFPPFHGSNAKEKLNTISN
jgi:serine/threonine protein kinase